MGTEAVALSRSCGTNNGSCKKEYYDVLSKMFQFFCPKMLIQYRIYNTFHNRYFIIHAKNLVNFVTHPLARRAIFSSY